MARSVAILRNLLSSTRRMVSMGLGLVSLLIGLGQGCHEGDSVRLGRAYLRKGIPARAGDARASIDSSFLPRFLHLRNILEYAVFRGFVWAEAEEYRGLAMPDEGRYADIARAMLTSNDWVTPRLN